MTEHNNPPDNITVPRELLQQAFDELTYAHAGFECRVKLHNALEQPAGEPVAWAYLFDDDGSLCQTFDTLDEAEKWAASSDNLWSGFIAPLYTAPQAQQEKS